MVEEDGNDGATKRTIVDFVARVTKDDSPDFVPAEVRIAVFDNDGTSWCEKPMHTRLSTNGNILLFERLLQSLDKLRTGSEALAG
jgi:hypothetical protein